MADKQESPSLINANQKQATNWRYEVHTHCALSYAEKLLRDKPAQGWELVSLNSYIDPRRSREELTNGDGTLILGYTLTFRRDESRPFRIVGEENVLPIMHRGNTDE